MTLCFCRSNEEYVCFIKGMQERYPNQCINIATPDHPCGTFLLPAFGAHPENHRSGIRDVLNVRSNLSTVHWYITIRGNVISDYKYAINYLNKIRLKDMEYAWEEYTEEMREDDPDFDEAWERHRWERDFQQHEFAYNGGASFDLAIGSLKSKRPNEVLPILSTVRHYADPNFR